MTKAGVITPKKLRPYLEDCGYKGDLLKADFPCEDKSVDLVGFAQPTYDCRTACIAVIDNSRIAQGDRAQALESFRTIGAPAPFVVGQKDLEWWVYHKTTAEKRETIQSSQLEGFFTTHKDEFLPERIYRAKNLGRLDHTQQLTFVDIGLMPLIEEQKGKDVSRLIERVLKHLRENAFHTAVLKDDTNQRWLFQAAFWLLCAKILHDKGVTGFHDTLDSDIDGLVTKVNQHYGADPQIGLGIASVKQRQALVEARGMVREFSSLANLATESLAYVYETVLVDKDLRRAFGIHATPSYLVDYLVWQLAGWIEEIPQDERVVLEPTCGHAPFLVGATRLLRQMYSGSEQNWHNYLKKRLVGIEQGSFAREIARLSLTLADVPNPNGWNLIGGDIFEGDRLSEWAKKATILLCNPPFENFTQRERAKYKEFGNRIKYNNKAAEMLWRTLQFMPEGSVIGVVLPQGFLHGKPETELRKMILETFEIKEIDLLPENVFQFGRLKSTLLFGRKTGTTRRKGSKINSICYRRVNQDGLQEFRNRYAFQEESLVSEEKFAVRPGFSFRIAPLEEVWDYCKGKYATLKRVVSGGQGLVYKSEDHLPKGSVTFQAKRFEGGVQGFIRFRDDLGLHELPDISWMNLDKRVIRRPQWGTKTGIEQIVMNYARAGSGPWRVKAMIDRKGRPVTSRFLVFRSQVEGWTLNVLWAILNGPLANAFVHSQSMERDNLSGTVRQIPIPRCERGDLAKLEELVKGYFALFERGTGILTGVPDQEKAKQQLLAIDAEVLRLYGLPPKYEKKILDLFAGDKRKGVGFEFTGYYPEGFESYIPLHEFLSEEYQQSTVANISQWVRKSANPVVTRALKAASEAFRDE